MAPGRMALWGGVVVGGWELGGVFRDGERGEVRRMGGVITLFLAQYRKGIWDASLCSSSSAWLGRAAKLKTPGRAKRGRGLGVGKTKTETTTHRSEP